MSNAQQPADVVSIDQPRTSDQVLARLIDRRATLKADVEYITGELEQIDGQIIELLGATGTHDVGGVKVQIREYTRTDYGAIEKAYPAAEYPQLYVTKTTLDQGAVKRQFAPAALEEFKLTGKKSVVIK